MELNQLGLFSGQDSNSKHKLEEIIWHSQPFLALDVETTGLDAASDRIIEIAMVPFNQNSNVRVFSQLFSIGRSLPQEVIKITGINDDMLVGKPGFREECDSVLKAFNGASFIVAYNASFDRPFLESELARCEKVLPDLPWVDPFVFICEFDRFKKGKKLVDAASRWGVDLTNAHRAHDDAKAAGDLILKMKDNIGDCSLAHLLARQKIWQWQQAQNKAEYKQKNVWAINR